MTERPPRRIASVRALEEFGRTRLSRHFFMRDFLYSEISAIHGIPNIPDDPDLAIEAGARLCEELLEPLQAAFGRIAIRSSLRCCGVNQFGNDEGLNCSSNQNSFADHIWDRRDAEGRIGATACIVVPWFLDQYEATGDWRPLAWWMHDHLPYDTMVFFPKLAAVNLQWREQPRREIRSHAQPHKGILTRPGMENHAGSHAHLYPGFPDQLGTSGNCSRRA